MFIRNAWYVAAWADEIGKTPLARRICDEPVVLYRDQQNRVAALHDIAGERSSTVVCPLPMDLLGHLPGRRNEAT